MLSRRVLALMLTTALASACAKPPPGFEDAPSAEMLYERGITALEDARSSWWFLPSSSFQQAIDAFQEIIDNYPYSGQAVLSELKIADAYFEQQRYDEALTYYRDFAELHPQHEQVSYAIFQAALSRNGAVEDPSRDQTATRDALFYLDTLLTNHPTSPYLEEAEVLWRQLRALLAENVLGVGDFYMKREEYQSAADRFRSVLNEYPGLGFDAEALYKLGVCYSNMNLEDEATRIFEVILRSYGDSKVAKAAQDLIPSAQ